MHHVSPTSVESLALGTTGRIHLTLELFFLGYPVLDTLAVHAELLMSRVDGDSFRPSDGFKLRRRVVGSVTLVNIWRAFIVVQLELIVLSFCSHLWVVKIFCVCAFYTQICIEFKLQFKVFKITFSLSPIALKEGT